MKKIMIATIIILTIAILVTGCRPQKVEDNGKYNVVTTTTLIGDLTKQIGGDYVNVQELMGPGVDPHLYKASAGDVTKMQNANMVIYNGLHLEGKMGDVFENIRGSNKLIIAVSDNIDRSNFLDFITNPGSYDPHIWFDVELWKEAAKEVTRGLKELDSEHSSQYQANLEKYLVELEELDNYIKEKTEELPKEDRVLITAHDAFSYFGKAYGFEVLGLQGISTDSEAGTSDVRELANYIVEHKIKAIFVESSVPRKSIEALQEAVKAQGFEVEIGGELYSDSTGDAGTNAETYIGTFKENIDTIVNALKK